MSLKKNGCNRHIGVQRLSFVINKAKYKILYVLVAWSLILQLTGCASNNKENNRMRPASYQHLSAGQPPQRHTDLKSRKRKKPSKPSKSIRSVSLKKSDSASVHDPNTGRETILASGNAHSKRHSLTFTKAKSKILDFLKSLYARCQLNVLISDKIGEKSDLAPYQEFLAERSPQRRADTEGRDAEKPLGLLKPMPSPISALSGIAMVEDPNTDRKTVLASGIPDPERLSSPAALLLELKIVTDPNTGRKTVPLTIEQTVARVLANSPEIRIVSFDPSIAKLDVTRAASEFDFTAFGRVQYEQEDVPPNSIFQSGQSDIRMYEAGIKQLGVTGAEWSVSYGLTRSWDDLAGRAFPMRYEPILSFQLKQPLLRNAWQDVTLAGVNIAKLNYQIALLGFRQKSEDIATQVISAYWGLVQARRDVEIHQELLDRTRETLSKVEGRREIDATDVQIKQTESFAKIRQAALLHARKSIWDAQEVLIRLMADTQLNMIDEFEVIPINEASAEGPMHEPANILEIAMRKNPLIQQARVEVEIADINFRVAENQKKPHLDLVASARTQGLHPDEDTSHDRFKSGDYASYAIGLSLEYPLGNRQRNAELLQRQLERRKAVTALQNIADQVAIAAKEGLRRIKTNHAEIQLQKEAVLAAQIHLKTLKDTEPVRERLTPEFLLVTLQAQETLANAQRAENRAIIDFNISLVRLAQILGTVLELNEIKSSMPLVPVTSDVSE